MDKSDPKMVVISIIDNPRKESLTISTLETEV